jgi:hypothetical protein
MSGDREVSHQSSRQLAEDLNTFDSLGHGFLVADSFRGCVSDLVEILWRRSPSIGIWA